MSSIDKIKNNKDIDNNEKINEMSNESTYEIERSQLLRHLSTETPESPELSAHKIHHTANDVIKIISLNSEKNLDLISGSVTTNIDKTNTNDFVFCTNITKINSCDSNKENENKTIEATFDDLVNEINNSNKNENENEKYEDDEEFTESTLVVVQDILAKTINAIEIDNKNDNLNDLNQPHGQVEELQEVRKTPAQNDTLIQDIINNEAVVIELSDENEVITSAQVLQTNEESYNGMNGDASNEPTHDSDSNPQISNVLAADKEESNGSNLNNDQNINNVEIDNLLYRETQNTDSELSNNDITINSMINDIQSKKVPIETNEITKEDDKNDKERKHQSPLNDREQMTSCLKEFSENFQYKNAQIPKRKQIFEPCVVNENVNNYDEDNCDEQMAKKYKFDKSYSNTQSVTKKSSSNNDVKLLIKYKKVVQIKEIRLTKTYIIKEVSDKNGKILSNEALKPQENKEIISENKSVKLIKSISTSSSSAQQNKNLLQNISLNETKNDDVFTDGDADENYNDTIFGYRAQIQANSNFDYNDIETRCIKKSISNSSINSTNSDDNKNNISTSTSINSIVNESVKTKAKSTVNSKIKKSSSSITRSKNDTNNKVKTARNTDSKSKQKESNKIKQTTSFANDAQSQKLNKPGPASRKQLLIQKENEKNIKSDKAEKNNILVKRTRKPRNYLVAKRYSNLEKSDDERNTNDANSSEEDEQEARSKTKTRKTANSTGTRQRENSANSKYASKRMPPAKSRSPPISFSHLRFNVTPKERNDDLITLKKSEAEYLLTINDGSNKKPFEKSSILAQKEKTNQEEAAVNLDSQRSKSSIKITSISRAANLGQNETQTNIQNIDFSMDCALDDNNNINNDVMMSYGSIETERLNESVTVPVEKINEDNSICLNKLIESHPNASNMFQYLNDYNFCDQNNEQQTEFAILPNNYVQNEVTIDFVEEEMMNSLEKNLDTRADVYKKDTRWAKSANCSPEKLVAIEASPSEKKDSLIRRSFTSKNSIISMKRLSLNPFSVCNMQPALSIKSQKKYDLRNKNKFILKPCFVNLVRLDQNTIQHYLKRNSDSSNKQRTVPKTSTPKLKSKSALKQAKSSSSSSSSSTSGMNKSNLGPGSESGSPPTVNSRIRLNLKDRVFAMNAKGDYVPAIITEIKPMRDKSQKEILYKCNFLDIEKDGHMKNSFYEDDLTDGDDDYDAQADDYDYLSIDKLIPSDMLEQGDKIIVYTKYSYKPGYFEAYAYENNKELDMNVEMYFVKFSSVKESVRFNFRHIFIKKKDSISIFKRISKQLNGYNFKANKNSQTAKKSKDNSTQESPNKTLELNESESDIQYEGTSSGLNPSNSNDKTRLTWDRKKDSLSSDSSSAFSLNTVRTVDTTKTPKIQPFIVNTNDNGNAKKILKPQTSKKKQLFVETNDNIPGEEIIKTFKSKMTHNLSKKSLNH